MTSIRIDMFEVQLGAAMFLQFEVDGRPVRVLADAGIKASGYDEDHVLRKLLPILDEGGSRHIDLIVGTHYDEDHLVGLVPVIENADITIGEAWMPPVANDVEPRAVDDPLPQTDLLAHQFYEDEDGERLAAYVRAKRVDVETLLVFEAVPEAKEDKPFEELRDQLFAARQERSNFRGEETLAGDIEFLREQLGEPEDPDDHDHAVGLNLEPPPEIEEALVRATRTLTRPESVWAHELWTLGFSDQLRVSARIANFSPKAAAAQMLSFGEIKKSSAEDAINAAALHRVVTALRRKNVDVRTEIIPDGEPRRYAWRNDEARFLPAARSGEGPVLTLLGPSEGLVRKHRNRLPVEQATRFALSFTVPIKGITPSNQLSYVMRLEHSGQGVLVTGDAGCVDFKADRKRYHQKLLDALMPLHVVQVAHHAGANGHFYRVLDAAGYADQTDHSYLLLSHATNDKHRPSDEFRLFLLGTLDRGEDVQLLSTSKPRPEKVKDFKNAFYPVVGPPADRGDISLAFDGERWVVRSHAVQP